MAGQGECVPILNLAPRSASVSLNASQVAITQLLPWLPASVTASPSLASAGVQVASLWPSYPAAPLALTQQSVVATFDSMSANASTELSECAVVSLVPPVACSANCASGCSGPGPSSCVGGCRAALAGSTCATSCSALAQPAYTAGAVCLPCAAECLVACTGPLASQCLGGCAHVQQDGMCMPWCGPGRFPNASGVCLPPATGARRVEAIFEMNGIRGTVSFEQNTLYDTVAITVTGFAGIGSGARWRIASLPFDETELGPAACANVGSVFDPAWLLAVAGYSVRCAANAQQCAQGDLSGKGLTAASPGFDGNLFLFGTSAISGRALSWTQRVCAAIGFANNMAVRTVPARLAGAVVGTVVLRQLAGDATPETFISLSLALSSHALSPGSYGWMLASQGSVVDALQPIPALHCRACGPLFDPAGLRLLTGYAARCGPSGQPGASSGYQGSCSPCDLTSKLLIK